MRHQRTQESFAYPAFLILASLVKEPKTVTALRQAVVQAMGQGIEPAAFSRVVARLERRGWIAGEYGAERLRLYHLTASGLLALQHAEEQYRRDQEEQEWKGGDSYLPGGKEIIMRLVLWILRLYPPAWRERYETEMTALLEQHQITPWTVLDLLVGALDARLDPHYRRARQLVPLRRFRTSWRLVIGALVAFWIALLPWLWMSVLGIGSDTRCSDWMVNSALCMLRVTVGMQAASPGQRLVGTLLGTLPLMLMAFLAVLVLARGRKARTHLLLVLPVAIGMLVLCLACVGWLSNLWPLLPQITQFYPQATAGLLAGLVGMGLATLLALGSLARASFALRALSAAAPRQESSLFSSHQRASEAAQDTNTPHLERSTISEANHVSKGWSVVLVALLLLFILSWTLLVISGGPNLGDLLVLLVSWLLTGIVGLITAWLVKPADKQQEERAARKPHRARVLKEWIIFLLILVVLFTFERLGHVILGPALPHLIVNLLLLIAISILPALLMRRRNSHQQARHATKLVRHSLSPRMWIIITPVLFLVFLINILSIGITDYPDFGDVLITWFLTGLATLIILVALKIGSRNSTHLPEQQPLQQAQVQG